MKNQSSLHALLTACALFALVPLVSSATTNVWNVATPGANPWSTGGNWSPAGPPGSADTALFGVTGTSANSTTVNNVVDANTTITGLSYTNTTSGTWHVTQIPSGITLTVSNTVNVGGTTNLSTTAAMTGGGTFLATGNTFAVGNNAPSSGSCSATLDLSALSNFVYNASAGTVNIGTTGSRSIGNLILAAASNSITAGTINSMTSATSTPLTGLLTLGSGINIINASTINIAAARSTVAVQFPGTTGSLKIRGTGGTDADRATVTLGNRNTAGTGPQTTLGSILANGHPVDMKIATLSIGKIGNAGATTNINGNGVMRFDQGIVDVTTVTMAVATGGNAAIGDATAGELTVGASGLLVIGNGGVSLANQTTFALATGNLNIFGGTATCAGSITKTTAAGTGNIAISSGFLTVAGTIGTPSVPVNNLNMTNATLTLPAAATASATVTNLNSQGTTNTINVSSVSAITVYPTQFPLIKYTTSSGDLTIIGLGTLPGIFQGYISNNTANLSIDVVLTGGPPPSKPVVWNGTVNGNWDTTTANWKSALLFNQNDFTTFDDTALGTTTVNLTTAITPGSLTINNSALNYTFNGTGGLNGSAGLTKNGNGTLVLDNSGVNNFSGGVTINAGTVQFGNNDVNGNLPALGNVTDNGSLVISRSDSNTVANVISGSGSVTNNGSGTLTLSAANSFTGNLTINAGTVRPTVVRAPGTGTLTVNSGGALVLIAGITNPIILAGGQLGTAVAQTSMASGGLIAAAGTTSTLYKTDPQNTTLELDVVITNLSGGGNIIGMEGSNKAGADNGNGLRFRGALPSSYSGTITVANNLKLEVQSTNGPGPFSPVGTGKIVMTGGTYNADGTVGSATSGGYSEINIRNNSTTGDTTFGNDVEITGSGLAVLGVPGGPPVGSAVIFNNLKIGGGQQAGVYKSGGNAQIVRFQTVTLTGGNATFSPKTPGLGDINSPGSDLSLGNIEQTNGSGAGIIMAGYRTLYLTGTNTYTGNTLISSGTLALTGSATISNTPSITIASGAKLDVSGLTNGTFALGSSQTLTGSGGTGTINSNVNMNLGSLALSYTNGTATLTETNGTLTFNNNNIAVTVLGATPLTGGSYKLISAGTAGLVAGSVGSSALTVGGAGVVAGHAASLSIVSGELYLVVTNRAPVANPSTYSRPAGFALKIPIIGNLATNWSDADGDAMALTGGISSTNGATVSYDSAFVYYSNPNNVADQINYTIGDGQGGTGAGIVNVTVAPASTNYYTQNYTTPPVVNGNGSITLNLASIPGSTNLVERTTNLTPPIIWTTISTNVAGANGLWQFTDPTPPSPAFYRTAHQP
jgi:autotransporter-associated beta strand protein